VPLRVRSVCREIHGGLLVAVFMNIGLVYRGSQPAMRRCELLGRLCANPGVFAKVHGNE